MTAIDHTLEADNALRPGERVKAFIDHQLDQYTADPDLRHISRLPSVKQLAERLDVSARTVASVYRDYAQRGLLRTEVGNGTFLTPEDQPTKRWLVGLDLPAGKLSYGDNAAWSGMIHQGILEQAGEGEPIMLLPLASPEKRISDPDILLAERDSVDGLILFAPHDVGAVIHAFQQADKPVISLNPPTMTATSDFVSPDYVTSSRRIGQAFLAAGRRRVLYLVSGPLDQSISTQLRLAGLVNGLGTALGESIELRLATAVGPDVNDGESAVASVSSDGWQPDAIYCAGDLLALGAIAACHRMGLNVPGDVSVVGGTGYALDQGESQSLTRCAQPLTEMGRALLLMMRQRLERPADPLPGQLLDICFMGGGTTTPEENQVLGVQ